MRMDSSIPSALRGRNCVRRPSRFSRVRCPELVELKTSHCATRARVLRQSLEGDLRRAADHVAPHAWIALRESAPDSLGAFRAVLAGIPGDLAFALCRVVEL